MGLPSIGRHARSGDAAERGVLMLIAVGTSGRVVAIAATLSVPDRDCHLCAVSFERFERGVVEARGEVAREPDQLVPGELRDSRLAHAG